MDLTTRLKIAKSVPKGRNPLREHLRDKLLEFSRSGRTDFLVHNVDAPDIPERRIFTNPQRLKITLSGISRGADIYAMSPESGDCAFIIGDVVHRFDVGNTTVIGVMNIETVGVQKEPKLGIVTLGVQATGGLTTDLVSLFLEKLDAYSELIKPLAAKSGFTNKDDLLNTVAFDALVADLAYARLICAARVTISKSIRLTAPPIFSPHPKISFARILSAEGLNDEIKARLFRALDIERDDQIFGVPDDRIRLVAFAFCQADLIASGYPLLDQLLSRQDIDELKMGVFGSS